MCRGQAVYDQKFHEGVNIIRGQNGSGKSTIADFIFYALGGEFDGWKNAASRCDEVQAEIETKAGTLTIKRDLKSKQSPVHVYFGSLNDANIHALEGWERFPIRRQAGQESFSQVMFRSLGIPEAQSEGASNITMHQLLRLSYSDQRTLATRLFRHEPFDTQNIREAVGDLVCGISGYGAYEATLQLRELDKSFDKVANKLSGLLRALPQDDALQSVLSINSKILELISEREKLENEILQVDEHIKSGEPKEYLQEMSREQEKVGKERQKIVMLEDKLEGIQYEVYEIHEFQCYLNELVTKLGLSEISLNVIGAIDFVHCPACGAELSDAHIASHCKVCKSETNTETEKAKYNQIRLDLEIQSRESKQLLEQKISEREALKRELRKLRQKHQTTLSEFEIKYSGSNGAREGFLAERTSRIGHISAEINFLDRSLTIAEEIDLLSAEKEGLQKEINITKGKIEKFKLQSFSRRNKAMLDMSNIAVSLLHSDLKRQDEFEAAQKVSFDFKNDSISVDDNFHFAESSNVFLKNSAILSLFLSAGKDEKYHHPRFLLFDNIEDKGMETVRSHLFQRLIVERATELEVPFQIIYTTSMMNPELELDDYTIGPAYSEQHRTLQFPD